MAAITVTGPPVERAEEILTADALAFVADLHQRFGARRNELLGPARSAGSGSPGPARLDFLPETADVRDGRLAGGGGARRPAGPAGRDHRADRAQDGDQRAQLRREGVAGRPRGRQHPALGATSSAARSTCRRRTPARSRSPRPRARSTGSRDRRLAPGDRAAAARLALRRGHLRRRRAPGGRRAGRLRALLLPQRRASCSAAAAGPYFYLPKMESHLEARLWNDVFTHAAGSARAARTARSGRRC